MYADNELYFDIAGSGAFNHDGYILMGGPGRAIFDRDSRAFLRLEPLGGWDAVDEEEAAPVPPQQPQQEEEPQAAPEPVVQEPVIEPVQESPSVVPQSFGG